MGLYMGGNMKLYFVRHGETEFNKVGRIQGRLDVSMNLVGFKQARLLAKRLSDVSFDMAFTSPLKRTIETAEEITRGRDIIIHKVHWLTDTDVGEWEGKLQSTLIRSYKRMLQADDMSRLLSERGGESFGDVHKRLKTFIEELEFVNADSVLVVTHAAVIYEAIKLAIGYPTEHRIPIKCHNCGITIIETENFEKFKIRTVNDTAHLEDF